MALFDTMRGRERRRRMAEVQQQAPQQAPQPAQQWARWRNPLDWQGGENDRQYQETELERMTAPRTTEEDQAYQLGERMSTEGLMRMAGIEPHRREDIQLDNRLMNAQKLAETNAILMKYMGAKSSVNNRVIKAQEWWKLKNWEQTRGERGTEGSTTHPSNTGWLWNCIVGKHADAIDSYPEPIILPRMADDQEEAKKLSGIVPVVLEMNEFEETYNDAMWQKMQEGTGVYGVFWNKNKLNGLGDVDIKKINILNLYWEPGVSNIQDSRNVFYISFENKKDLEQNYPQLQGKLNGSKLTIRKYKTDDQVDDSDKAAVVDWYYKIRDAEGHTTLHYCKYVDEYCLYSSEEKGMTEGFYADGNYPFVLDALFPVEGSPAGYGYIDIAKDSQMDIDTLSQAMVQNAAMRATPRYFMRKDGGINEKEFSDWSKPIVHTNGNLSEDSLRPIEVGQMGGDTHKMLQQKIDEIKFITGNTDINNGGVPSGVTAASAIAALKEDSGRSSKDSTKAAYRAYRLIVVMVIERIRQFYDIPRQFRIIGNEGADMGQAQFTSYSNAGLQPQVTQNMPGQDPGLRLPVFDIEVRAQRENAYTKMSQNELALQFWGLGAFNPQMTDQVMMMLDMMDFRGKEKLIQKLREQGTLQETLVQMSQIALALAQKYDPAAAQQIAMMVQQFSPKMGGPQAPANGVTGNALGDMAPDDNMSAPHDANENKMVRRAGERAANASRPS